MVIRVSMPKIGEVASEGTIVSWLKNEGDRVEKDEPLCIVEVEKVTIEIRSPCAGTLSKVLVPEGKSVPVDGSVATVVELRDT